MRFTVPLFLTLVFIVADLDAQRRRAVRTPDSSPDSTRYVQIAAGGGSACAIREDGVAFCWGHGAYGELGNGAFPGAEYRPVRVGGGPWQLIRVGGEGACGLSNGTTYCWGTDFEGGLGQGFISTGCGGTADHNAGCSPLPVPVTGGHTFRTLTAGGNVQRTFSIPFVRFNCGITEAGDTLCWGSDSVGTLGGGTQAPPGIPYPQPVTGNPRFLYISAGLDHTCALDAEGAAWCWGAEQWGELGNDDLLTGVTPVPTPVATSLRFKRIGAARNHTCGITLEGETYCWGLGGFGQLGAEGLTDCGTDPRFPMPCSSSPVRVASDSQFTEITLGIRHTCALDTEGQVFCWGSGWEVGVGDAHAAFTPCPSDPRMDCALTPLAAATDERFSQIAAGRIFTCGLNERGEVFCWGSDATATAQGIGRAVTIPTRIVAPGSSHLEHAGETSITAGRQGSDGPRAERAPLR